MIRLGVADEEALKVLHLQAYRTMGWKHGKPLAYSVQPTCIALQGANLVYLERVLYNSLFYNFHVNMLIFDFSYNSKPSPAMYSQVS